MTGPMCDPRSVADAAQRVRPGRNTAAEERQAALVVCDRAKDAGEAGEMLAALGLVVPAGPGRWRPQDRVRGWAKPKPSTTPVRPGCGSVPGAQAHHRAGEPLCALCQAWSDERHRKTRTAPGARCGTRTGAQMHRNLGEAICEACRVAEVAERRENRADDPSYRESSRSRQQAYRDRKRKAATA